MKALSSTIVVLSGAAMQIAASRGATTSNRETLFNWGVIVLLIGLGGWIYSLHVTRD